MLNEEQIISFGDWIVAINKMGSAVLPWIENPNDTDYEVYVTSCKELTKLSKLYSYKNKEDSLFVRDECWFTRDKRPCAPYCYQYHYAQKLYGRDLPEYNIFEHKEDYKQCLVKAGLGATNSGKFWYHILTGIYMLENGDYTLTEAQIANIRLCHDQQMTTEAYEFIQNKLKEYQQG